ncbi:MAG: tryptophan 7-halogenase [Alphaproteobacteria bacterium]|nr:tryptophan 7-halogenase [Alphaproteobacteria bacterium]
MEIELITDIVIVGGGTAGWMTAAAVCRFPPKSCRVRVIESDEIGPIGVGEATIPAIKLFNSSLGVDEAAFLRETQGTFKLGIEFVNWWRQGHSYTHAFGAVGRDVAPVPFHHFWLKMKAHGKARPLRDYSLNAEAQRQNKFARPGPNAKLPLAGMADAYHFDASLYARFLRRYAEAHRVTRTEGKVVSVNLRGDDGFIESVTLQGGEIVAGDLFIDCTGFRGLLIEEALKTGYEDWTHWLPCNRAVAVQCETRGPLTPYTKSTAHEAGWQWRIPLQHRVGNGYVYCSEHLSDEDAKSALLAHLEGPSLTEPRVLRFTTGKRRKTWNRNCVAIGLAGGFLEPLESTGIHMIQSVIGRLLAFFPNRNFDQADIDEFNRRVDFDIEHIRDFIILHYKATQRDDTPFWRRCREMDVPAHVKDKMALFGANGRISRFHDELFSEAGWLQVMVGQGIVPRGYHPLVDEMSNGDAEELLQAVRGSIEQTVGTMSTHSEYIARYCAARAA